MTGARDGQANRCGRSPRGRVLDAVTDDRQAVISDPPCADNLALGSPDDELTSRRESVHLLHRPAALTE